MIVPRVLLVKNLGTFDRFLRVLLAELCILIAFFWAAQEWQIPLYLAGVLVLVQAATGRCGLYGILGWNSCEKIKRKDKNLMATFLVIALVVAVVGSYASIIVTKNIFIEDLSNVIEPYSLTIQSLSAGQGEKAIEEHGLLESAWRAFQEKYSVYRPFAVRFDEEFALAMQNITTAISSSGEEIRQGHLAGALDELQRAEPSFQELQKQK
ncbi:MAG: hypothetical protein A4E48_01478 [Methanosaeta sp. PtaU1.Bin060]|jgi:hypothetical protein|nr:MAG: hypothetical protein A4E48_01478 [Methanosaeta sp. PtaU1.Bin060]